jgi:signal transduction histidine kinase/DNA-binding NarL/FixJ family response regulator/streptogramin lyase
MVGLVRFFVFFFFFGWLSFDASSEKFYNVNSLYGISLREVNSVCSDYNGFVWASSKAGVLRLSQDDFKFYDIPYDNSSTNVLKVTLTSKGDKLIAYTDNGQVFLFDPILDRFELLFDLCLLLDKKYLNVHNVLIGESDHLYISSTLGFYKYYLGQLSQEIDILKETFRGEWYDTHRILLMRNAGIWLFDTVTKETKLISKIDANVPIGVVSHYFDKEHQQLYIGTLSSGLYLYDFSSASLSKILDGILPKQPIRAIEKCSGSNIFLGIDGQGVWVLDKDGSRILKTYKESIDDPTSLKGNGVYDIYCDPSGRVWVCTYSGGVSYFNQSSSLVQHVLHQPNNANTLVNNDVNNVVEGRDGSLWFATNNGLSCWDVKTNKWRHFLNDNPNQAKVFLSICEDDNGLIWAGSYSSGVYVLDGKSGRVVNHYMQGSKEVPLLSNFILDVFKDSQGNIWMGGVSGHYVCYLSKEKVFKTYKQESIGAFAEINPNQILLGCSYGLLLHDKQIGDAYILLVGFSVRDLYVKGDEVWICATGSGLVRYNLVTRETRKFTTLDGLPSNFVNSIVNFDGYFWIGTENGLCRFNPIDNSFLTYPSIYQLSRTSFNNASYAVLRNGQLAWGTNNGVAIFYPNDITDVKSEGTIYYEDLLVAGQSVRKLEDFGLSVPVDSLESIRLKYFQNSISLDLLPIKATAGVKFSWKLEGFDKQWSQPTDNRLVNYTNIPNGDFVLKIRLFDNSLSHIIAERTLSIEIVPPFWKSLWFWIVMYVVVIGLALLVLQYIVKSLRQKHTEEKVRFFTNTAHDIRTSLTLIKAPVEELSKETNLSEAGKYYLKIAIDQSRRLAAVVTQLMDFQKADIGKEHLTLQMVDVVKLMVNRIAMFESIAKNNGIVVHFESTVAEYFTAVDEAKLERLVDNLISNAVKYSHTNGKVWITLDGDKDKWGFQVKDEGIGLSKDVQRRLFNEFYRGDNAINSKVVGSGIGLLLVKNYVTLHNGTVSCTSQENVGSVFEVSIPYKKIEAVAEFTNSTYSPDSFMAHSDAGDMDELEAGGEERGLDMKILVVEDNEDLMEFMKRALSPEFTVFCAENGQVAWDAINKQAPDLVVSDIMMPVMDGFDLCRLMKSTYETSHIPIVLLTALSEKTEQLKGLGLGADDYLTKPFDMSLLSQRIKSIIHNRAVIRDRALKIIKSNASEAIVSNELNDKFMKKMIEVARANITNCDFNKDEFASCMNVSSSLLYKKVKALTNLSPTDFIKVVRLNHALELLQTRQYNVTEVSELCGFINVGYFSTVFRKHFGKTPTDVGGNP